ncbi:MAG: hypothetical protein IJ580_07945 [Prevotella sp.]|nr:hypothetical protein [Prevotella sp.]
MAVITELIETMQDQLQNSKRVKLKGLGAFKIGIENTPGGAATAAEALEAAVSRAVAQLEAMAATTAV